MNAVIFSKTFDVQEGGQLALSKSYDSDDEKFILSFSTLFEDEDVEMKIEVTGRFELREDRDRHFETFTQEDANGMFEKLKKELEKALG